MFMSFASSTVNSSVSAKYTCARKVILSSKRPEVLCTSCTFGVVMVCTVRAKNMHSATATNSTISPRRANRLSFIRSFSSVT